MGESLSQKIMARTSGRKHVAVGEVVECQPDVFSLIDLVLPHYINTLKSHGITKIPNPERCVVFADHEVPSYTVKVAALKKNLVRQMAELGITKFYAEGRHGISHQTVVEKGHVLPGMLVIGPDTHITTLGCVGALAPPINYEAVQALAMGDIWLKVPETIRVRVSGRPKPGVMSRDIAQQVIHHLGTELSDYRVIEFSGPAMADMDMDMRMTLCNVAVDIGAKCGIVEPDEITRAYLAPRTTQDFDLVKSDPDAAFCHTWDLDLGTLEPMVAAPPRPDNVMAISKVAGIKIDQVYIGSCAGGRMEDLRAAAAVIRGRKVHPRVRMIVVPTSQEIFSKASREGLLADFVDAGAVVTAPACGPCYGNLAPLVDGDVCIGTGTTNIPGRMGSSLASIYISNAAVAAASAIAGEITDPALLREEVPA